MKLLLISPFFFEPHRWMISAYKTALSLSRSIDVVVLTTGSPLVERLNPRLTVYRCRDWFLPDPVNYSVVPGFFSTLRRIVKEESPTVFLVNKHMFFTSLSVFALRRMGKRVLLATDAFPGMTWFPRRKFVEIVMRLYARTVGLAVLRRAELVILLHEGLVPHADRLGLPWRVIHNGVDLEPFRVQPTPISGIEPKGSNEVFVTYVGRLESIKGYDVLLRAAHSITSRRQNVRVLLVGNTAGKERVVEQFRSRQIQFLGHRSDVPNILLQSDIFVLPSFSEGLPNALMEAMAAGAACVATNVGGVPSLISDGVHGLLVPPRDEPSLVSAFECLLDDPSLRRRLGKAARERIERDFNWDSISRAYLELFRSYEE